MPVRVGVGGGGGGGGIGCREGSCVKKTLLSLLLDLLYICPENTEIVLKTLACTCSKCRSSLNLRCFPLGHRHLDFCSEL